MLPLVLSPVGFSSSSVCGAPGKAPLEIWKRLVNEELAPLVMYGPCTAKLFMQVQV